MKHNTEADVRTDTAIKIAALFFVSIMFLAFTTDPIASGTKVGERAPPLEGMAYNGSVWTSFDMNDYVTNNWTSEDASAEWLLVEFMDTDCPFCVNSAEEMGQNANYFMKLGPQSENSWRGPVVNFVASATELDIQGHESSRDEIQAFRDRTGGEECAGTSCGDQERIGPAHNFIYIDDLDQDNMKSWKVPGTPAYFLIQPDGIVAWTSADSQQEKVADGIFRIMNEQGLV